MGRFIKLLKDDHIESSYFYFVVHRAELQFFWNRGLYKYPNTYPKAGGDFRTATLSSPSNSKKNRFCSQFDIKLFTWFMIQMKSAAEMG